MVACIRNDQLPAKMSRMLAVQSSLLALSQGEEVVDFLDSCPISASEDEDDSGGERQHLRLLEAISDLDGKRRQRWTERSEAGLQVSEFNISTAGTEEKLTLSELLEHIKPSSSLVKVKRQLKKVRNKKSVEFLLSREDTEQVRREAAYSEISRALTRWDTTVLKNRRAQQLVFPLQEKQVLAAPTEELRGDWTAQTPLEQEIFSLLHKNQEMLRAPSLTPEEKASLKAMSLDAARQRRAELQKARALQSYFEARARRQKKIKSKKFHQVLRKKKAKKVLRSFKGTVSPPASLEDLEKREVARMEERMSLSHQSKGRWARAAMAKHDQKTRKEVQEQLARNKELTQKPQMPSDSEQEEDADECRLLPQVVNEVQLGTESLNPWMQRNCCSLAEVSKTPKGPQKPSEDVSREGPEGEKEEMIIAEDEPLLQELEKKRALRKRVGILPKSQSQGTKESRRQEHEGMLLADLRSLPEKIKKKARQDRMHSERPATTAPRKPVQGEGLVQYKEEPLPRKTPMRVQTLEETESLGMEECTQEQGLLKSQAERRPQQSLGSPAEQRSSPKSKKEMIDLQASFTVKSHKASALSLPTMIEEEDFDAEVADQKQIIKEAFAGDDIFADFLKEKREAKEGSWPKAVTLSLPGWGKWGGPDLKKRTRKRRRHLIKAPDGPPRKSKSSPNVIFSEMRNIQAAAHKVNVLPFPFSHPRQFERTIQTPVGSTWNTPRAFQEMTAPRVVVKQGHIIEPIKVADVD